AQATVEPALHVIDLETRASAAADRLFMNDIGHCVLALDRSVAVDRYADNKETGSFILIDPESCDTIGMGLVEEAMPEKARPGRLRTLLSAAARPDAASALSVRSSESHIRSIAKAISWRGTGSLDTFLVTLVITGSYTFAGSVAITEVMTKITLYYFHER